MAQATSESEVLAASVWQGCLSLSFINQNGKTQLIPHQIQAPLKIQRPFYPEGPGVCHSLILHTAGGMVGGDRLALDLKLDPGAQALITTAAAAKVYRSNGAMAHHTVRAQVAEGACLEWLPRETIVFNGAVYAQDLRVDLAPDAAWLGWEVTRFGRTARGEQFRQGQWRSRTEIWRQGRPLWIDPQFLQGGTAMLTSPHGLAAQPVVGSLAWIGQGVSAEFVAQARSRWSERDRQGEAGVTRLPEGVVCRYRGPSSGEVRNWFTAVWHLLRQSFLKRPACPPRVWR